MLFTVFVEFPRPSTTISDKPTMAKPVLAYWDIRGLAQPARLLLNYAGVDFEDKMYVCGPPPDYDKTCWFGTKHELGLDFPNLPYYIDGDVKLTQSNAILRHIARKTGLDGQNDAEKVRIDLMAEQSMDFRNGWVRLCYNSKYDELVGAYEQSVKEVLEKFSKFLADEPFFAGKNVSWVDFVMYELLDQHRMWKADVLKAWPNLEQFLNRVEALPTVKAYMQSEKFMKTPVNNKMAKWGG